MHNIRKFAGLAYQSGDGGIKLDGKAVRTAANHISSHMDLMFKIE
jgi:hypothetical protein